MFGSNLMCIIYNQPIYITIFHSNDIETGGPTTIQSTQFDDDDDIRTHRESGHNHNVQSLPKVHIRTTKQFL